MLSNDGEDCSLLAVQTMLKPALGLQLLPMFYAKIKVNLAANLTEILDAHPKGENQPGKNTAKTLHGYQLH